MQLSFKSRFQESGRRFGMVAAAVFLTTAGWVAIGNSGVASAATACSVGSSGGNIVTCISAANGVASASVRVVSQSRSLQLCVTWDGLHLRCSGYRALQPGGVINSGQISFAKGTWCAHTWRLNGSTATTLSDTTTTTQITQVCV